MKSIHVALIALMSTFSSASALAVTVIDLKDPAARGGAMSVVSYGEGDIQINRSNQVLCTNYQNCKERLGGAAIAFMMKQSIDEMVCERSEIATEGDRLVKLDLMCTFQVEGAPNSLTHELKSLDAPDTQAVTHYTKYSDEDKKQFNGRYRATVKNF